MKVDKIEIEFKGMLENKNITTKVLLELNKEVELGGEEYREEHRKLNSLFTKFIE